MTSKFVQIWYWYNSKELTDECPFGPLRDPDRIVARGWGNLEREIIRKYGSYMNNGGIDASMIFIGGFSDKEMETERTRFKKVIENLSKLKVNISLNNCNILYRS